VVRNPLHRGAKLSQVMAVVPPQRWWCATHFRAVKGDCPGPVEGPKAPHAWVNEEKIDLTPTTETGYASYGHMVEDGLVNFLNSQGFGGKRWFMSEFEIDYVAPPIPKDYDLKHLLARCHWRRSNLNSAAILKAGDRVFFEVSASITNRDAFLDRCTFKVHSIQKYQSEHTNATPANSVLVYFYNQMDPSIDFELMLRKDTKASQVIRDIHFLWCKQAATFGEEALRCEKRVLEKEVGTLETQAKKAKKENSKKVDVLKKALKQAKKEAKEAEKALKQAKKEAKEAKKKS